MREDKTADQMLVIKKLTREVEELKAERKNYVLKSQKPPQLALVEQEYEACDKDENCEEVTTIVFHNRDPDSNRYNPGWRDHPSFKWNKTTRNSITLPSEILIAVIL